MKKIFLFISFALISLCAMSQSTFVVCQSTSSSYEIDPADPNSTYAWKLDDFNSLGGVTFIDNPQIDPTDPNIVIGTEVTLQWENAGTYNLLSQETNIWGCKSPWTTQQITVSEKPVVDNMTTSLCSYSTENQDVLNLALETTGTNGATVGKWILKDIKYYDTDIDLSVPGSPTATKNATEVTTVTRTSSINPGDEFADANALKNDSFVNSGTKPAVVVYTLTPKAGDCSGNDFTIDITVFPTVNAPTIVEKIIP